MGELLSKLVTFTEPLLIGGFAVGAIAMVMRLLHGKTFDSLLISLGRIADIVGAKESAATKAVMVFVVVSCVGTIADGLSYYVFEDWVGHARHVQDYSLDGESGRLETGTNKRLLIPRQLNDNLKDYSVREVEGLLSKAPLKNDGGVLGNSLIDRATYSLRLERGICVVSILMVSGMLSCWIWPYGRLILLRVFTFNEGGAPDVADWPLRLKVFLVAVVTVILSYLAYVGGEYEYHHAARLDAVRFLLMSDKADDVVRRLSDSSSSSPEGGYVCGSYGPCPRLRYGSVKSDDVAHRVDDASRFGSEGGYGCGSYGPCLGSR